MVLPVGIFDFEMGTGVVTGRALLGSLGTRMIVAAILTAPDDFLVLLAAEYEHRHSLLRMTLLN